MAVTITLPQKVSQSEASRLITVNFTADGDAVIEVPDGMFGGSIQFAGTFGSGTIALQASNDGVTYITLAGLNTGATAITTAVPISTTSANMYGILDHDRSYHFYRVHLTGSTSPNLNAFFNLNTEKQN